MHALNSGKICDYGKTRHIGFSMKIEFDVYLISYTIEPAFRFQIVCFAVELQHFLCDRATPPTIKKLRSKILAMHAYGISVYYAYTEVN